MIQRAWLLLLEECDDIGGDDGRVFSVLADLLLLVPLDNVSSGEDAGVAENL